MPLQNPNSIPPPVWGHIKLAEVIERKPGFYPATGYHIYCELRPVKAFEATEDDDEAARFVSIIDQYAQMGSEAALTYGLVLLEFQGRVLHFFKEGEATQSNTDAVIDFVHEFTQSAYDELRDEMEADWHGFASAFDHGRCILLNQTSQLTMSTVSLGPSANNPAKRLFSLSPAGCVSAPSRLVGHLVKSTALWCDIDVKRSKESPSKNREVLHEKFSKIRRIIQKTDQRIVNFSAHTGQNILHMNPENPLRLSGSVVRCDLDGFTALVEAAFDRGEQYVAIIAQGFKDVMNYAEIVANSHQPCIMLPWAGDCATFLLPDDENPSHAIPRWLAFSMDWLASEIKGFKSPLTVNQHLAGTKWGIGAAHGESGNLVVASSVIQSEHFLVAAGWPYATSRNAQESAKADQLAIDPADHKNQSIIVKSLFDKKNDTSFWWADHPSQEKLRRKAVEIGVAMTAPQIITSSKLNIPLPPPSRPYSPSNA